MYSVDPNCNKNVSRESAQTGDQVNLHRNFIREYTRYLNNQSMQNTGKSENWDYWRNKKLIAMPQINLSGLISTLSVSSSYHQKEQFYQFELYEKELQQIDRFVKRQQCTIDVFLMTILKIVLFRYTNQTDILVTFSRSSPSFNLPIFFKTKINSQTSFIKLLREKQNEYHEMLRYQDYPINNVYKLISNRNCALFKIIFSYYDDQLPFHNENKPLCDETGFCGIEYFNMSDIHVIMKNENNRLIGKIIAAGKQLDQFILKQFGKHYQNLILSILKNESSKINEIDLLSNSEKEKICFEWNNTDREVHFSSVKSAFEAAVSRRPEKIAVVKNDQSLSYAELNNQANRLAHYLARKCVKKGNFVCLALEHSTEMIIGILAVMKCGGIFVPLNLADPSKRSQFIQNDTAAEIVITNLQNADKFSFFPNVIVIENIRNQLPDYSQDNFKVVVKPDDLFYVMYTSGTTGIPKGVKVSHKNVLRLVCNNYFAQLSEDNVFLNLAPYSFDASTLEIWGSLVHNAKLVIIPESPLDLDSIADTIIKNGITILWLTSGLFNVMVEKRITCFKSVKQLLIGGDVLSTYHVEKFLKCNFECRLINGYGPTENTTFTTSFPITDITHIHPSIPIGKPIANTKVYILDEYLKPVPIGIPGELYFSGAGLAQGYLNNPELTARKFIPNPFSRGGHDDDRLLYKSGDYGYYLSDGNIRFCGRKDDQIKFNGYRIELREIEACLSKQDRIKEAVVLFKDNIITALIKADDEKIYADEIRGYLEKWLPPYMIPHKYYTLDVFPLTENGKVNRQQLLVMQENQSRKLTILPDKPETADINIDDLFSLDTREDEITNQLMEIWKKLLGINAISAKINLAEFGVDSLLIMKFHEMVKKSFNIDFSILELFTLPNIESQKNFICQIIRK